MTVCDDEDEEKTTQAMCIDEKSFENGIASLSHCAVTTREIDHKWNKSEIYWNIKENK